MDSTLVAALVGAIVGGLFSFGGAYFQLRGQTSEARKERKELGEQSFHGAIKGLITEFHMNAALDHDPKTQPVWVPYQRDALTAALPYLPRLPAGEFQAVQKASHAIALYNELAAYANGLATAGTRQTGATDLMGASEKTGKAAMVGKQAMLDAAAQLEAYRGSLTGHSGTAQIGS